MDEYKKQLEETLNYALENGTWSKRLLTENAEVVCAYGLGTYFRDAFDQWKFRDMFHVNFCCDKDENNGRNVAKKYGLEFVNFAELLEINKTKRVVVLIFVGNSVALQKDFVEQGLYVLNVSECIFEELCNMPKDLAWFRKNRIMEVFDMLADEESKRIYVNVLAQRMAVHMAKYSFADMNSDGEYFRPGFFQLSDDEIFCDCGAYTGDTISRFLDATNGKCRFIYGYEMAKSNYSLLVENVGKMAKVYPNFSQSKYKLIQAGVWDHKDIISYGKEEKGSGESFGVFKTDDLAYADAVTIDETTDLPISLLKMDIEGAELNALSGGANVLLKYNPKLAICIYHRLQDFWMILTYVKSIVPEYKIYVRHHGDGVGGTVMYGVV